MNKIVIIILCFISLSVAGARRLHAQDDASSSVELKAAIEELTAKKSALESKISEQSLQITELQETLDSLAEKNELLEASIGPHDGNLRQPALIEEDEDNLNKQIHINLGFAYARQDKIPEALEEYKKALFYDPQDKDIHYNLGFLYAQAGNYDKAIQEYKKAVKGSPEDKEIYYNLAIIYSVALQDPAAGEEYFYKYQAISSADKANSP